ncbi:MAG: TerC family protein [Candidatus Kapaibacteriales bacterium]
MPELFDFSIFASSAGWIALGTLTLLEIVLGIDNVIFISIIAAKLPKSQQPKARNLGLILAMVMRLLMLFGVSWLMQSTEELFSVFGYGFSIRDLILLIGGLFLIGKSVTEIHAKMEGEEHGNSANPKAVSMASVITQILLLDLVFSFDSILTAIGLSESLLIIVLAIIISIIVMITFAGSISDFIEKHPTLQILALSFLILIGFMLTLEGVGKEIEKGYIYFAVAFSLVVEFVNIRMRKNKNPVQLRRRMQKEDTVDIA